MPAIIPGYVYTMVAFAIIGALLLGTVISYAGALRSTSETEQLKNIMTLLAAKTNAVAALVSQGNSTAQATFNLPDTIGSQQYWLSLRNDSASVWVTGGLGTSIQENSNQIFLPNGWVVDGDFVSNYGPAVLEASVNGSTINVTLRNVGR
jgi:type II secretory pathway pseudopilin PulG